MFKILIPWKAPQEFRRLKSEKKWMLALLAVFVPGLLSLAGNMLIQQKQQPLTNQLIEEQISNLTVEQRAAYENFQENFQSITVVLGIVIGIVIIPVVWAVKSVIFHILAKVLGGQDVDVSSTIHLIAYTYLPFIFKGLLDVFKGLTYQVPSYQEFMYQIQNPDILLDFVRENLNIFALWALFLMGVAVKEQYNLSNKKAFVVVLIPYLVLWVIIIALTSLGTQFMGGM